MTNLPIELVQNATPVTHRTSLAQGGQHHCGANALWRIGFKFATEMPDDVRGAEKAIALPTFIGRAAVVL